MIPVAGEFVRHESDQREDGLRRADFHPDTFNRLEYTPEMFHTRGVSLLMGQV